MKLSHLSIILTFLVLLLSACGGTEIVQLPATEAASPVINPTSTKEITKTPISSPQPTATNTEMPTVTQTSTPSPTPIPIIKLSDSSTTSVNLRAGPGTNYPIVGRIDPGQEAVVTGRNEGDNWWQISLNDTPGWIFGELVTMIGDNKAIAMVSTPPPPPPPPPTVTPKPTVETTPQPPTAEELADSLRCGKDFCVTYQDLLSIEENGGCVGNHSIYITVLEGPPPGKPMDGVVIGDTFNNVEVGSGSHGPGRTEITLWSNSMILYAKRHQNGTPYTSEESFKFTTLDELIPAELLAAKGYCEGSVEKCRWANQHNQVCRGHYSWRVTFHKFD